MRLGSPEWTAALLAETAEDAVASIIRAATYAERLRCQMAVASPEARAEYARGIADFEAAIEVRKQRITAAMCRRERAA